MPPFFSRSGVLPKNTDTGVYSRGRVARRRVASRRASLGSLRFASRRCCWTVVPFSQPAIRVNSVPFDSSLHANSYSYSYRCEAASALKEKKERAKTERLAATTTVDRPTDFLFFDLSSPGFEPVLCNAIAIAVSPFRNPLWMLRVPVVNITLLLLLFADLYTRDLILCS